MDQDHDKMLDLLARRTKAASTIAKSAKERRKKSPDDLDAFLMDFIMGSNGNMVIDGEPMAVYRVYDCDQTLTLLDWAGKPLARRIEANPAFPVFLVRRDEFGQINDVQKKLMRILKKLCAPFAFQNHY